MTLRVLKGFREGGRDYKYGDPAPAGLSHEHVEKLKRVRFLEDVPDEAPAPPRKRKGASK